MELEGKLRGLDWLVEEVEVSLQQASEALESYLADPDDEAQIRFCLSHIHQVHGSLKVAECHGPLLLSEEMELLAEQLRTGEVNSTAESCDVLVQAILRLPPYVRKVIATRKDQPETLLLLLNELRAVRGQSLVTESAFFTPELTQPVISSEPRQVLNPKMLGNLLRKLRQMYQFAVLGVIKGDNLGQNFTYLGKVFSRLQELSKGSLQRPLWDIAQAFLENISGKNIHVGIAVKVLLRELDVQIKALLQGGAVALNGKPSDALLKNLLFYVAYGGSNEPASALIRQDYQLDTALPTGISSDQSTSFSAFYQPEIAENIVREIEREIDQAKEKIECYVAQGEVESELLEEAANIIQRMSDSLAIVGAFSLRHKLNTAKALINQCVSEGGSVSREALMPVATLLIEVESGLYVWLEKNQRGVADDSSIDDSQMEVGRAKKALFSEARNGLDAVKESIVEFIASQWDRQHLEKIPPLIENVAGALEMLSLTRAQTILRNCNRYLTEQLLSGGMVPDWNSLDALADALTSVEYYLEYVGNQDASNDDTVLAIAEKRVAGLGYPVTDMAEDSEVSSEREFQPLESSIPVPQPPEEKRTVADDDPIDPEIVEVFIEEAGEVLANLGELCPIWSADPADHAPLIDIRRAFHTLKGSGRMVGAEHIGDLAWAVEGLLNKVLDKQLEATPDIVQLVDLAVAEIPAMVGQFQSGEETQQSDQANQLIDLAGALARGEGIEIPSDEQSAADAETTLTETPEIEPESGSATQVAEDAAINISEEEQEDSEDRELLLIFAGEAEGHLQVLADFVMKQQRDAPVYSWPSSETQSALHTLKGSALMAEIEPISNLIVPLEQFAKELYKYQQNVDSDIVELLADGVNYTRNGLQQIHRDEVVEIPQLPQFLARLEELRERSIEPILRSKDQGQEIAVDPAFLRELMTSGMDKLLDADEVLQTWSSSQDTENLAGMQQELGQLCEAAGQAGVEPMAAAAALLESVYDSIIRLQRESDSELLEVLKAGHSALLNMIDRVAARQYCEVLDDELQSQLVQLAAAPTGTEPVTEPVVIESLDGADIDTDILQVFVEEAGELLETIEQALHSWSEDQSNPEYAEALKRALHTLKGGARMAGLIQLGDISHHYEDAIVALEWVSKPPTQADFSALESQQDVLLRALQVARDLLSTSEVAPVPPAVVEEEPKAILETVQPAAAADIAQVMAAREQPKTAVVAPVVERRVAQYEMIRVSAPRLESLVNLAGETSISRGRIEQQISGFGSALEEMDVTIRRLQDQVRRIGIEADAQVISRQDQIESTVAEGFDPLEMDRYSRLQQLTRGLLESASDLHDLKETLIDKSRDAEAQLLEQARINTDLQESMMQTRMVPFSRMVPRLRRMVRQLSEELSKNVQLKVANVDGEMDRSVMESILAPLEHMIRNSLSHGIESVEQRVKLEKPKKGTITIGMTREGGDILIRLSDDGRGLDLDGIRQRAIALGLIQEEVSLDDQEIIQFIFQAGFSTSKKVSQVSGRGVGMDVVNSQVRQLGGSIETLTSAGDGTQFTIRLPFTVSVNRALMVRVGEDSYALPLNTVDGVVSVNPAELEHYYRFPDARLEYAGGHYQVRYLGSLLKDNVLPKVDFSEKSTLLMLVHSETRLYAVQIDELLSNEEIVVKGLGSQFSSVPGISGATVRGDGRVVVILDLLALLRSRIAVGAGVELLEASQCGVQSDSSVPTVMVVDDSVTVRKVTSRFLAREGFHVLTAKDGEDALRVLQDQQPDVMLLDIEMPRMDGFEVASRMKNSDDWKNIPIIMITSRTGEKHRQRAFSLGVKKYLGKPYQEDVLLQTIDDMLNVMAE